MNDEIKILKTLDEVEAVLEKYESKEALKKIGAKSNSTVHQILKLLNLKYTGGTSKVVSVGGLSNADPDSGNWIF